VEPSVSGRTVVLAPAALKNVLRAADMAQRWGSLKTRVLALKAEREDCALDDYTETDDEGRTHRERLGGPSDGEPCRAVALLQGEDPLFDGRPLTFAEWCGPCQRNEARYRLRQLLQRKLRDAGRRMLVLA
jgi:hypothetical protein